MGPGNHVLDRGPDTQGERGNFGGCLPHGKALGAFCSSVCKKAELIEMPFLGLTHVGPRKHVLDVVNFGQIHSPPSGVIRRRCGLSSKFFDHLFTQEMLDVVFD